MDKYKLFNEVIPNSTFTETFATHLKYDLLVMSSKQDTTETFFAKMKAQYDYKITYESVDYRKKDVIEKYGLHPKADIYAVKKDVKNIHIVFNKKQKSNLNRYLAFKVFAYEMLDDFFASEVLQLTLNATNSDMDNLAEQLAIAMVINYGDFNYIKNQAEDYEHEIKKYFLEPELIKIREKEHKNFPILDSSTFRFYKKIMHDSSLIRLLVRNIKYIAVPGYAPKPIYDFFDNLQKLHYSITFQTVDFNDSNIVESLGFISADDITPSPDIYAKKSHSRGISILFNYNLKPNINRYLGFKVMAYEFLDLFPNDEQLCLSLKTKPTEEDRLAELMAIEFVITEWELALIKRNACPYQDELKSYLEPELIEIRNKYYDDKCTPRNWTLASIWQETMKMPKIK